MRLRQYIVDAFVRGPFTGNPAAVVPLDQWIDEDLMQSIASENNLSETAFVVCRDAADHELRWFTPTTEVDLCGHATLATAHVLARELNALSDGAGVTFHTRSGALGVEVGIEDYALDLPAARLRPDELSETVLAALGQGAGEAYQSIGGSLVAYENAAQIEACAPDFAALAELDRPVLIVTAAAASPDHDFVARVFAPKLGINEDPATGSAQCALGPFWIERLGRSPVRCLQISARGAELVSEWTPGDERVTVSGRCATFSRGELDLPG